MHTLQHAEKKIGDNVTLKSLMRNIGVLKANSAATPEDVVGFNYITHWDNTCYEYYAANPPLLGLTQPQPVPCPLGIELFNNYKIDYKKAIDIFHTGNWGSRFTSIVLSKPLIHPPAKEPYWYFRADTGVQVVIGADTGEVISPK